MARLLFDGVLFDPMAPNSLQPAEYGKLVLDAAAVLYPTYIPVACEIAIRNPRGNALTHLALVDNKYRDWWLVVLETGESPGLDEVMKQIEILRAAKYSEYPRQFVERNAALDLQKVSNLMKREVPRVFVLLGHPPPPPLKDEGACVGVAEIFEHGESKRRIVRINGVHPTAPPDLLTHCTRHMMVPAVVLELEHPELVPAWNKDESDIEIGDVVTTWRRTDETITPVSACSLPSGSRFRLVRTATGRLRIVPA